MADEYEKYAWKEREPGVWSRACDEAEIMYATVAKVWAGTGRKFFYMTGHVRLDITSYSSHEVDTALTKAWLALRYHHPTFAAQVVLDSTTMTFDKVYREEVGDWVQRTLVHVEDGQTGKEFSNSDPPAPDEATLFVTHPRKEEGVEEGAVIRRDLVFRSPHDIIDGVGTLQLFNKLASLIADALSNGSGWAAPKPDGSETKKLSPPFRVAANVPKQPSAGVQQRITDMAALATTPPPKVEVIGLPLIGEDNNAVVPGKHQRVDLTMGTDATQRLMTKAKEMGVTPTHLFHAAIAVVLRNMQERRDSARLVQYWSYTLVNDRPGCVAPYDGPEYADAVYHSVSGERLTVEMEVPAKSNSNDGDSSATKDDKGLFLRVTEQMRAFYQAVKDDKDHYAVAPYIATNATPALPPAHLLQPGGPTPPVPPPKKLPSVSISSLGRLDGVVAARQGGDVEVRDPWVTGEELGNGVGVFLGTHRGEMSLSAAYNDAWRGREEVLGYLGRCVGIVGEALDLDLLV
ncbi:hypothetical protein N3K66_004475 [Trichothecium roseum]|uniref:Uncharacterized protein n=1 Tax=Trichothecium roseum TaxID=47278 RepID=A0ACC0V3D6_9HYPO|nr:hypothetical protein N3K66_004475 [Trichothecium roseum]